MSASLRKRFILGVVAGLATLLCIAGIIIFGATKIMLFDNFDKSLLNSAKILSAVVEDDPGDENEKESLSNSTRKVEFEINVNAMDEFNKPFSGSYYQFSNSHGQIIIRSPSLKNQDLPVLKPTAQKPQYYNLSLPDGSECRAISFDFTPKSDDKKGQILSVTVARQSGKILRHLAFLKRLIMATSAGVIVLSILLGMFITGAGLRPVHFLANEISAVEVDKLDKIVNPKKYPKELRPIVKRLNSLLEKLRISFEKEKQFNRNIAHELRTPLSGIKSIIEVSLSQNRQSEEYKLAMEDCLKVTNSMNRMVDSLLFLTKAGSRSQTSKPEQIFIRNMVEQCWVMLADKARDKGIEFENNLTENLICFSDKTSLYMVITNILDNAVEYCNSYGTIRLRGKEFEDQVIFSISNTGCRLEADQVANVFDTFWTGDISRKDTGRHCGIGLTIVKKIIESLGGIIEAAAIGEIFTIKIKLQKNKYSAGHD